MTYYPKPSLGYDYNPIAEFDGAVDPRLVTGRNGTSAMYDFAFPTRSCPSNRTRSAIVPMALTMPECHRFPICLCGPCRTALDLDAHLDHGILDDGREHIFEELLGRDFALWVLAWCIQPRQSKRYIAAENARLAAVEAVARLSAHGPAARVAVMALAAGDPWE